MGGVEPGGARVEFTPDFAFAFDGVKLLVIEGAFDEVGAFCILVAPGAANGVDVQDAVFGSCQTGRAVDVDVVVVWRLKTSTVSAMVYPAIRQTGPFPALGATYFRSG